MITHKNAISKFFGLALSRNYSPRDISLFNLPLFHVGSCSVLTQLRVGITVHLMRRFDPQRALSLIEREKISITLFAPTMFNFLLSQPDISRYDTSSIRQIAYGTSPMPVELLREGIERFGSVFYQSYGLTESTGPVTTLGPEEHIMHGPEKLVRRLSSCGKGMMNVSIRVVDDEGSDVKPDGHIGEIVVRGDSVMKGYWNQPEATAETIVNGWLRTGDMAWVDEDGYIFIADRRNDIILSGGENIYPREVEDVIYRHPSVEEVAVIGYPDEAWGQSVRAIVRLKEGRTATEQEIIEFCKAGLASYKKPRSVVFVQEELPRNPSGKILKKVLREKHEKPG